MTHLIQQQNVYDVYDNISEHFSHTRHSIWDFVKEFLDTKGEKMKGVDIGCGNGKNMMYNPKLMITGFDICSGFVDICKNNGLCVFKGDCLELPCGSGVYDYAMSIAVYHHIVSNVDRKKAIREMLRVLKPGGQGMFSVWSVENQEGEKIKRTFRQGDNFVNWTRRTDKKVFQRYYHVFTEEMIIEFMDNFRYEISDLEIFNEKGNWVVKFVKNYQFTTIENK